VRRDLIETYQRWLNDFGTTRTLSVSPGPMTIEAETEWFAEASRASGTRAIFTIYERATMRPIGNAEWRNINHRNRTAEYGLIIGEPDVRGRGYGTETTQLMLDYAFTALGLHSVQLTVFGYNLAAQRVYEKAGFKEIGRWRDAVRLAGNPYDIVYMDCLATEFVSPLLYETYRPDEPRS
jgi:RimJ/RimL family protein N-acetyltransferase